MENIDLSIHIGSVLEFEQDLRDHPKQYANSYRLRAQAVREWEDLKLEMEVVTSQIVQEILEGHVRSGTPIPPSAVGELRRTRVPLDKRYQKLQRKINKAKEAADILSGVVAGAESKGYRLRELLIIAKKMLAMDTIEEKQDKLLEWK